MNTRSRFTISTVLGVALVGLCLSSAHAQSGKKMKMHAEMSHEMMDDDNMDEWTMPVPAPIGYPFSAPGGLHLYHYTDYTHEGVGEGSSSMKRMENMEKMDRKMHDRDKMRGPMMTDENGMTMKEEMKEPAPIGYPFAAPAGLHLYHYTDYTHEGVGEGSSSLKRMENMEMHEKMLHERRAMRDKMMMDDDMMPEPAPIGYPFAAPGGLHLYHYTDYTHEGVGEGSSTMKKMDNSEKMEKKRDQRMKNKKMSN